MKNKILALTLIGFLGLYMVPTLLASSQRQDHRAYPEFKPLQATDAEIVQKASLTKTSKGKPIELPKKPSENENPVRIATGFLGDSVTGNKYAIIVGIANYPGTANDLRYADEDAYAMKNVLITKYGFSEDNIIMLVDEGDGLNTEQPTNATASKIQSAILELRKEVEAGDEVVFFYSGHGGKGKASDGDSEAMDESIISHDGTQALHIWDGQLKLWFAEYKTDRIVFFFDSCVSGGMTDLAGPSRIVNMATWEKRYDTAVERYYDDYGGAGEFTYYFVIKGMGDGLANILGTEGENVVTVEEAFDYAKANAVEDHPTVSDGFALDLML